MRCGYPKPKQHALAGSWWGALRSSSANSVRVPTGGGSFTHMSGEPPGDAALLISTIANRTFSPGRRIVTDTFRCPVHHVRVTRPPPAPPSTPQKRRCAALHARSRTIFAPRKALYAHHKALYAQHKALFAPRAALFAHHKALYAHRAWLYAHRKDLFALRTHEFAARKGVFDARKRPPSRPDTAACHRLSRLWANAGAVNPRCHAFPASAPTSRSPLNASRPPWQVPVHWMEQTGPPAPETGRTKMRFWAKQRCLGSDFA